MQKTYNLYIGWILGVISSFIYFITKAPSVSYWDCGEFITSAYKLEIGHPPGAPLYLLIGRFFSLFASSADNIASCINCLSVIASGVSIAFLFWTIKILLDHIANNTKEKIKLTAAAIASLTFAFTDSFWFSATEAEVYSLSLLFTAITFWAILKWRIESHNTKLRWIILISFLIGLSIGVHILNLLTIPALTLSIYLETKKSQPSIFFKGIFISILVLFSLLHLLIPLFLACTQVFEIVVVNYLNFPIYVGGITFIIILFSLLSLSIFITYKLRNKTLNIILLCLFTFLIGFTSYFIIIIRSNSNPPLNENAPDNIASFIEYFQRDQYGERPLLYGSYYNAPYIKSEVQNESNWEWKQGSYQKKESTLTSIYSEDYNTIFPRMYSKIPAHKVCYDLFRNSKLKNKPSQLENLQFFTNYQVSHMYFRYLFWNFIGKQNDYQGNMSIYKGNWNSGIDFIDELFFIPQKYLTSNFKNNKGHNTYFLIPLILGIIGMIFQIKSNKKGETDFLVLLTLFFFTGIAITIYLNQTPMQARERDYSYLGSFYTFSIWIGFGSFYIIKKAKDTITNQAVTTAVSILLLLVCPIRILTENWDDHDRSSRYVARELSKNYLESCNQNAILFTYGDNDTFPLWYLQEVESLRTDIRIINTSLLNTQWYTKQLSEKKEDISSIQLTNSKLYKTKTLDYIPVLDKTSTPINARLILRQFIFSKKNQITLDDKTKINYIPSHKLYLTNQTTNDTIFLNIKGNALQRDDITILDIIAHNKNRPIYFNYPAYINSNIDLESHLIQEGFAFRFNNTSQMTKDDLDLYKTYNLFINKFNWGNLGSNIYIDHTIRKTTKTMDIKNLTYKLSKQLLSINEKSKAKKVLEIYYKNIFNKNDIESIIDLKIATIAAELKKKEIAKNAISNIFSQQIDEIKLNLYINSSKTTIDNSLYTLKNCLIVCKEFHYDTLNATFEKKLKNISNEFNITH